MCSPTLPLLAALLTSFTPACFYHQGLLIELRDASQYVNHSETPLMDRPLYRNGETLDDEIYYATRNIQVGEELTAHYGHFAGFEVLPMWLQRLEKLYTPGVSDMRLKRRSPCFATS